MLTEFWCSLLFDLTPHNCWILVLLIWLHEAVSDFDILWFSLSLNGRESPTTILTIENWKPECICNYSRLRMYAHVNCSQSINARDARQIFLLSTLSDYLSVCLFVYLYLFVYYVCINRKCMFVYVFYPLLEHVNE